jgi:hypothetical protein
VTWHISTWIGSLRPDWVSPLTRSGIDRTASPPSGSARKRKNISSASRNSGYRRKSLWPDRQKLIIHRGSLLAGRTLGDQIGLMRRISAEEATTVEEPLRGGQPRTGSRPDSGAPQSQPELDFVSRWRQLVDKAGGQAKAARLPGWSRSTASRDYNGKTLPTDERLHQLCQHLRLSTGDELELTALLGKARTARRSNLRGDGAVSQEQARDSSWYHAVDHSGSAPADDKVPPGPGAVRPPGRGWTARRSWRNAV